MKKIGKISLILLMILCMMTSVYAVSCSMSLQTAKNEFNKNDEVVVDVAISSIETPEGIIGLKATLEYNKNSLSYVGMTGENGWSTPSYNEANGILVMDRNALVNSPETILKITFKVKDQSATQNATITLKDITVSGGESTGDISVPEMTKTITITKPDNSQNNNTTNNNTTNNNVTNNITNNSNHNSNQTTNKNTNTTENPSIVANTTNSNQNNSMTTGILPKAGVTNIILIVLAGALILAIIFYVKIKTIDKNMGTK